MGRAYEVRKASIQKNGAGKTAAAAIDEYIKSKE